MAWHIEEQVIRGEIDNRTRGKTTGRIWLVGRDRPVTLELTGNPWRDLAGHVLRFSNPSPKPGATEGFAVEQRGAVGDMTASTKVKVPEVSPEELTECYRTGRSFPWHWGNALYLEWFGAANGRVVIEAAHFSLRLDGSPAWTMSEAEELAQRRANEAAMGAFMDRLTLDPAANATEDEAPRSRAEAEADRESERMDRLLDRVLARLEREPGADFETILAEVRERLRRERGEPEPAPAESSGWEDAFGMSDAGVAFPESDAEAWQGDGEGEARPRHPLVTRCTDFAVGLHREVRAWLPEGASAEHPLAEIVSGVMLAGGKLAGALSCHHDEWPPAELFAGDVLVRLKKARSHLRDALAALDAADLENLATPAWRLFARSETGALLAEVEALIAEVRR